MNLLEKSRRDPVNYKPGDMLVAIRSFGVHEAEKLEKEYVWLSPPNIVDIKAGTHVLVISCTYNNFESYRLVFLLKERLCKCVITAAQTFVSKVDQDKPL